MFCEENRNMQVQYLIHFINFRLGIRREDLPKYEEQLDLKIAKAELEELKKDCLDAMETVKKRYACGLLNELEFGGTSEKFFDFT